MDRNQIADFLRRMWPANGQYFCVSVLAANKRFDNVIVSSPEQAADTIVSNPYAGDWYYALASFKQLLPANNGYRTQANADEIKVVTFDVDCGEEKYNKNPKNAYPTIADGIVALNNFCNATNMPSPAIVLSGYGFHVYWIFTDSISIETWQPYADTLKAAAKAMDFRIDLKITADSARVLRPTGAVHTKSNTLVTYHDFGTEYPFAQIAAAIEAAGRISQAVVVTKPKGQPAINSQALDPLTAAIMVSSAPPDAGGAFKHCKQLNQMLRPTENPIGYHQWYHGLQIMRFFKNDRALAHHVSALDSRYDEGETERHLQYLEAQQIGPTLCATFDQSNPGGCAGCPHKGRINTPLVLAREVETNKHAQAELKAMAAPAEVKEKYELPDNLPQGYEFGAEPHDGIIMSLETGKGGIIQISPYWAYVRETVIDSNKHFTATVAFLDPRYGWRDIQIPFETLAGDSRSAYSILGANGLLPEDDAKRGHLMTYLTKFALQLRQAKDSVVTYENCGWTENHDGFVMGDRIYRPHAAPEELTSRGPMAQLAKHLRPKGDLNEWKKIPALYNAVNYENHRIAVLLAPAAMLFEFTGMESVLVSFYGDGGQGKSTSMAVASSFFGDPAVLLTKMGDTEGATMSKMGMFGNLLLPYDEMAKDDPEVLRTFILTITKGRDKSRLLRTAGGKYVADMDVNQWRTIVGCTTNRSVIQTIDTMKGAGKAEASRVLELRYTAELARDERIRSLIDYTLKENHGLAAAVYLQYVVDNIAAIQKKVRELRSVAAEQLSELATGRDRYYISLVSTVTVAAILCKKLGLLDYDPAWVFKYLIDAIRAQNQLSLSESHDTSHTVANFYYDNIDKFLVNKMTPNGEVKVSQPRQALFGRIVENEGKWTMYVRVGSFRSYCQEKGINEQDTLARLKIDGVYDTEASSKVTRMAKSGEYEKRGIRDVTRVRVFHTPILSTGEV